MKKIKMIILIAILLCITISTSGCLGSHEVCPECAGAGRDPGTLYLTECEHCGGDGEVGLFMADEDAEDVDAVKISGKNKATWVIDDETKKTMLWIIVVALIVGILLMLIGIARVRR